MKNFENSRIFSTSLMHRKERKALQQEPLHYCVNKIKYDINNELRRTEPEQWQTVPELNEIPEGTYLVHCDSGYKDCASGISVIIKKTNHEYIPKNYQCRAKGPVHSELLAVYPAPILSCSQPIKIAEKNDILLSVRAPVGDINITPFKSCIGRGFAAIRPKGDKLNYLFLFYYIKFGSRKFESLSMGSTFKAIRKEEVVKFQIPLSLNSAASPKS
jgi:hypothetical protein